MVGVGTFFYPLVSGTGVGSLLSTRISGNLDKQFLAWALSRLDSETLGFAFRDGEIRFVDRSAVSSILGIRSGSKKIGSVSRRSRISLVEHLQVLLGLHVSKAAGITVDDLKKMLQTCDPDSLERKDADAAKIAFTLLACVTYLSPRHAGSTVPEELLECVLVPDEIGQYDWAGYVLAQLSNAAKKFQLAIVQGSRTVTLQCCSPLLQVQEKVLEHFLVAFCICMCSHLSTLRFLMSCVI
jgi:hypothetical protein